MIIFRTLNKFINSNMKKALIWIVVIGLVIWGLSSVAGKSKVNTTTSNEANKTAPVKIGFVGPLTGDASSMGVPANKAVQLAIKEVNDAGGINGRKIELITEDGKCNTKAGSDAGAKLISADKVTAIIGGLCSGETSAFGPNAMQNKVVTISYLSSSPALSNLGKYFFRNYPSDTFQGAYAADYVFNKLGKKKVAVVYSNTDWGTGVKTVFVEKFKSLGGTIVLDEGVTQDARDFRTVLSKVKSSGAEFAFVPMYNESAVPFLKQVKESGIKIGILGGDAWADTKLQEQVDGTLGAMYVEVKTGTSDEFSNKFTTMFPGEKVSVGTAQAYDATNILLNALKKIGTENPDALAEEIRSVKYNGVSGYIAFGPTGDMTEASYLVKKLLGNGKVEEVK